MRIVLGGLMFAVLLVVLVLFQIALKRILNFNDLQAIAASTLLSWPLVVAILWFMSSGRIGTLIR